MVFGEVNSLTKAKYEDGELRLTVNQYTAAVILEVLASSFGFGISLTPNPSLEKDLKLLRDMKQSAITKIQE